MSTTSTFDVRHKSRALTEGPERAAARSYLHGIGYSAEDLAKPIVGVAHSWIETMPCNFNNRVLAAKVKEGIREAGGTPMELNTIAISDGITMGTAGMRASLVSRELIADSIELVASAHHFDALVTISGCDKTIPGTVMALARLDIPGLMLYGGSIRPGWFKGEEVTIQQVFEAVGEHRRGQDHRGGAARARGGRLARRGRLRRAVHGQHDGDGLRGARHLAGRLGDGAGRGRAQARGRREVGELVMDVLRRGQRPSEIITKQALENAIAAVAMSGGSTNGVLHLLAVATRNRRAARDRRVRPRSPSARRCSATCSPAGSTSPPISTRRAACRWCSSGWAKPACCTPTSPTVTGRTIGEHAAEAAETDGQASCARSIDPLKPTGGFAILRGNVAPDGCVVKLAGHERRKHTRPGARVRRRGGGDGGGARQRDPARATWS